jgi:hypothetical protein
MTHEPTTETKTHETGRATPKCSLSWNVDPASGKPVARWTVERLRRSQATDCP